MANKTPRKYVYKCNHFCRICDANVSKTRLGNYNIFNGEKAKKVRLVERLSSILECQLQQDELCSSIICINCFRKLERMEKAIELITKEIPIFKTLHDNSCSSQSSRWEMSRFKRCHKGSPLSAEKPPKQQVRRTKKNVKVLFPISNEPARESAMSSTSVIAPSSTINETRTTTEENPDADIFLGYF